MVSQSFTFIQKPLLTRNWSSKPISENFKHWDEEIGEMMRFVIAHEVGHALGFP
jgi:predicted Zn-dependent protease with MMP-like domain